MQVIKHNANKLSYRLVREISTYIYRILYTGFATRLHTYLGSHVPFANRYPIAVYIYPDRTAFTSHFYC